MTAACLGVLLVAPQGATAAKAKPKPSKLAVTSLQSPPSSIGSGGRFTISGRVRNTGGRTAPALLGVTLRAGAHPQVVYSLGAGRVSAVRPGRTVAFRIRVTSPKLRDALKNGFVLQACVKTSRKGAERCRTAAGRVVVRPTAPVTPTPPTTPTPPPVTTPTDPTVYTSGARTRNDSLFPTIGNGGYDALHYDLRLGYTNILTRVLRGTATITAKATQNLKDFSLDFQGMPVSAVTVDGQGATHAYDLDDNKLVVTPAAGIKDATTFTVQVTYGGSPSPVIDPDASQEGWLANSTYGAVALGEPLGSQGWFPVNNVPYDKATYDITVTTPSTFQAMSNGRLVSTDPGGDGTTTYHWREGRPMAPYLATVTVGQLDQSASDLTTNPDRPLYIGIDQSINASSPANKATLVARQQRVPAILDWYGGYYGVPYPFEAAGGIVPRVGSSVGYVLETQTKPTYPSASANTPGTSISTIAHENAHQWFGNLVTLTQWRDIWLNEGLTEFSSWLWEERQDGGATTASIWDDSYATTSTTFWNIAPAGPPSAADIFDGDAMYTRGAMVAEGMRQILGESQFVSVMHDWLMRHAYANGTTEEFIALVTAADPARADRWTEYFRQWLYTPYAGDPAAGNKPQITPANFDTYVLPVVP